MRLGKYLRIKRLEKKIGEDTFANLIGVSVSTLYDLEEFDDDEISLLSILQAKNACKILGICFSDIYAYVISDLEELTLPEIVKKRREEKSATIEDIADSIGYHVSVIEAIENNRDLDSVNIDALKRLACVLDIPFEFLLDKI